MRASVEPIGAAEPSCSSAMGLVEVERGRRGALTIRLSMGELLARAGRRHEYVGAGETRV